MSTLNGTTVDEIVYGSVECEAAEVRLLESLVHAVVEGSDHESGIERALVVQLGDGDAAISPLSALGARRRAANRCGDRGGAEPGPGAQIAVKPARRANSRIPTARVDGEHQDHSLPEHRSRVRRRRSRDRTGLPGQLSIGAASGCT
jgi:hypothetical protein